LSARASNNTETGDRILQNVAGGQAKTKFKEVSDGSEKANIPRISDNGGGDSY
jgi:hypothetical protein